MRINNFLTNSISYGHHKNFSYKEELIASLNEHQIEFDEKYLL